MTYTFKLCDHCPLHPPMKPCRECAKPFRPKMPAHVYCSFKCSETSNARKYLTKKMKALDSRTVHPEAR